MKHGFDDLSFTLAVCRHCLPEGTARAHFERIDEIENVLRLYFREVP